MVVETSRSSVTDWLPCWHVLHTAPNHERQLAAYLHVNDVQAYVAEFPKAPGTRPGSVRDRRSRLVFPGYVFLRVRPSFDRWEVVSRAPGVRALLQQDGSPAAIDEAVMSHLQRRIAERMRSGDRRWVRGQRVVVERGPLAAMDAIFERELDSRSRVQVLIEMMGRQLTVTIDSACLRASYG